MLFLCSLSQAENLGRITLQQAIDLALKKNYTLKSLQAQTDSARAKVEVSKAGYLPKISATAGIQKTKILSDTQETVTFKDQHFTDQSLVMSKERDINEETLSLTLSQNIFDFGKRYYTVQQSKSSLKATVEDLATTRSECDL